MNSKIVSFTETEKPHNLSRLMIVTLTEAFVKQQHGIPFGPVDMQGRSFISLIKRGLIVRKEVTMENKKQSVWQLTPQAIDILRKLGVYAENDSKS